ncbi:MAG: hypothetical protein ACREL9_02475 [Gemmatimonadales bacterium]
MKRLRPSRTLTTVAVGFLLLDAVLLVFGGLELHRPLLVALGGVCGAGAAAVVVFWRRHRRTIAELEAVRREMRAEVERIRDLLQSRHFQN